jgi:hypothetical protein
MVGKNKGEILDEEDTSIEEASKDIPDEKYELQDEEPIRNVKVI